MKNYIKTPVTLKEEYGNIIMGQHGTHIVNGFDFPSNLKDQNNTVFGRAYIKRNLKNLVGISDNEFIYALIEYILSEFSHGGNANTVLKIKAHRPYEKYSHKFYIENGKLMYIKKLHQFYGEEKVIYSIPRVIKIETAHKTMTEKITRNYEMNYTCYFYTKILFVI
jgi:hypothetical protein